MLPIISQGMYIYFSYCVNNDFDQSGSDSYNRSISGSTNLDNPNIGLNQAISKVKLVGRLK